MKHYDLIIIGGGGGTKIRPAASLGKTVAIVEKEDLGGTCLNRGCIPSKMFIYLADLVAAWREGLGKFEWEGSGEVRVDFRALSRRINQQVQSDSARIALSYEAHSNIDFYRGHARFVGGKILEVNGQKITAEKIYIATGTRPNIPTIPGLEGTPYMTSREALRAQKLPKKMIIIGGGYIAVELGHVYGALGCEVHFLVRSGLIKNEDQEVREAFTKSFTDRYQIHLGVTPNKVEYQDGQFTVAVQNSEGLTEVIKADSLFVATGVQPNTDDLGLECTRVKTDGGGWVQVNDQLETGEPGVYALGDVLGRYLFRHSVNFEGEYLLGQHYAGLPSASIDYPPMPHAIFSCPQVAGVGVTEDELVKQGRVAGTDFVTVSVEYKNSAMGMAMRPKVGLVKLIADKNTGRLIGAHIVGDRASDIIHLLIAYMTMRATANQLLEMIYIHPALSEVIRNAARKLVMELEK